MCLTALWEYNSVRKLMAVALEQSVSGNSAFLC